MDWMGMDMDFRQRDRYKEEPRMSSERTDWKSKKDSKSSHSIWEEPSSTWNSPIYEKQQQYEPSFSYKTTTRADTKSETRASCGPSSSNFSYEKYKEESQSQNYKPTSYQHADIDDYFRSPSQNVDWTENAKREGKSKKSHIIWGIPENGFKYDDFLKREKQKKERKEFQKRNEAANLPQFPSGSSLDFESSKRNSKNNWSSYQNNDFIPKEKEPKVPKPGLKEKVKNTFRKLNFLQRKKDAEKLELDPNAHVTVHVNESKEPCPPKHHEMFGGCESQGHRMPTREELAAEIEDLINRHRKSEEAQNKSSQQPSSANCPAGFQFADTPVNPQQPAFQDNNEAEPTISENQRDSTSHQPHSEFRHEHDTSNFTSTTEANTQDQQQDKSNDDPCPSSSNEHSEYRQTTASVGRGVLFRIFAENRALPSRRIYGMCLRALPNYNPEYSHQIIEDLHGLRNRYKTYMQKSQRSLARLEEKYPGFYNGNFSYFVLRPTNEADSSTSQRDNEDNFGENSEPNPEPDSAGASPSSQTHSPTTGYMQSPSDRTSQIHSPTTSYMQSPSDQTSQIHSPTSTTTSSESSSSTPERVTSRSTLRQPTSSESAKASSSSATSGPGRPTLPYEQKGLRAKQKSVHKLIQELLAVPQEQLLKAIGKIAKTSEEEALVEILGVAGLTPEQRAAKLESMRRPECKPITPDEALRFLLDNNITKKMYQEIRKLGGSDRWPAYNKVRDAKKLARPAVKPETSDLSCRLSIVAVLHHTAKRLVELSEEVIDAYCEKHGTNELNLTLISSWGFDGSSGHSRHKMKFDTPGGDDNSLFATTCIPLAFQTDDGFPIWQNPAPQSTRFCRPIWLQFAKETKKLVCDVREAIEREIRFLKKNPPALMTTDKGNSVKISFECPLTLIDGKIFTFLVDETSQSKCGICGATPIEMNQNIDFHARTKPEGLEHGISPLHSWIRVLELLLNIGYRNQEGLMKWRVNKNKEAFAANKKRIQDEIFSRFGLHVDKPDPRGGNTNDGNTARMLLSDNNLEDFCKILRIEKDIAERLHTILIVINCGLPINADAYEKYTIETRNMYIQKYGWYYMPQSVHKLLVHGAAIIRNSLLPLGALSEHGSESRNKDYRSFRGGHARRGNREDNLKDVFNRCMESSDPIISSDGARERSNNRRKFSIPSAAANLLLEPEVPVKGINLMDEMEQEEEQMFEFLYLLDELILERESEENETFEEREEQAI